MSESLFHVREPWLLQEVENGLVDPWPQRVPALQYGDESLLTFNVTRDTKQMNGCAAVARIPEGLSFTYLLSDNAANIFDGILLAGEKEPYRMRFNGFRISDASPLSMDFLLDGEMTAHTLSPKALAVAAYTANMELSDKLETTLLADRNKLATIKSNLTLYRARAALNADGLFDDKPTYDSFDVQDMDTAARAVDGSLFFGELRSHSQYELQAKARLAWDKAQGALTSEFIWSQPQTGLFVAADRSVPRDIQAEFNAPVSALRVESKRHRTFLSFCRTVVTNGNVRLDPVDIDWGQISPAEQQAVKAKLVEGHMDKIVNGKIMRYAPVSPNYSDTL